MLDPKTTPNTDLVRAYTLCFENEAGKMVLADLDHMIGTIDTDIYDSLRRIDPMKLARIEMARWFVRRLKSIPALPASQEWQALESVRKIQASAKRIEENHNG